MEIKKEHLRTLWYEDMKGNYLGEPDYKDGSFNEPPQPYIQVARFPMELNTRYLKVEDNKSKHLMTAHQTWNDELVLNMYNNTDYSLYDCIIIVATSCERCLNVLINKYGGFGDDQGYEEGSPQWKKVGTSCRFCSEEEGEDE
jgi:hypothetical protein